MTFKLTIDMGNAAFFEIDYNGGELARILSDLAGKLEDSDVSSGDKWPLMDSNGNKVGEAKVTK